MSKKNYYETMKHKSIISNCNGPHYNSVILERKKITKLFTSLGLANNIHLHVSNQEAGMT